MRVEYAGKDEISRSILFPSWQNCRLAEPNDDPREGPHFEDQDLVVGHMLTKGFGSKTEIPDEFVEIYTREES